MKPAKVSKIEFVFLSENLGAQTHVNILLPYGCFSATSARKAGLYKTLYLLHGKSDDYDTWHRCSSVENLARQYGIAVIMPDAGNSFYRNMVYGNKVYSYIVDELPEVLGGIFPLSMKKEDTFIAGFSMGGYGALSIAVNNADRFSAVGCFSSATDVARLSHEATVYSENELCAKYSGGELSQKIYDRRMFLGIFGDRAQNLAGSDDDLFTLIPKIASRQQLPYIFQTCGRLDYLYKDNLNLYSVLKGICKDYDFIESEGEHEWSVWNENIHDFFRSLQKRGLIDNMSDNEV